MPFPLLPAQRELVKAGGAMHSTDLAAALGIRAQELGKLMTRILGEVGISRPGNGTVSPGLGRPLRNGYAAETLAAPIEADRCRAELSAA
ncbi:hypothetical protein [Streptomyces sp. NBC_01304]|uniref:hypothetical protein n=1 Tax=Streptomyces sp. NBC_01304 TaxID=2903818 RepID=UPI002E11F325|nr:hypothetical protein OG430_41945 [Streptomyces sp. NBC_01304]